MSYRTRQEIYGDLHSRETKPGSQAALIGACLGLIAPGIGRMLAKTGWFAQPELLEWGTILLGFACIAGGIYFGWLANKRAREEAKGTIDG